MSRLPPAEKLPLAARKNIRDNYEQKKEGLEKKFSDVLGVPWTINININEIYPYAKDGTFGKESPGSMVADYLERVLDRFSEFFYHYGEDVKDEINAACTAHVITMDVDLEDKFSYCGCKVTADGELVILFNRDNLATNTGSAMDKNHLTAALDAASTSQPMSFSARRGIVRNYAKTMKEVQEIVNKQLKKDIVFEPNFEATYDKLKASGKAGDFDDLMGSYIANYFDSLRWILERNNVCDDDMILEAIQEEMGENKVAFRLVDSVKSDYGEAVFEGGILYIQTDVEHYGSNVADAASKVLDQL